ncbi:MAG: HAMP domain-containing protein [Candidatus Omnitrophica bacterium]|nr:HAMP domain-containing protein [Candidatus Omnitrophota bacterium]MCK5260210.1 HAMP domain-containing protein [Candidatus Omnitrophota bacterium]
MFNFFRNLPITTKLVLWFLFVALVPLAIATKISYDSSRSALVDEITNSLFAVADNKANQIETYLREKARNVTTLSYTADIIDALEKFDETLSKHGAYSPEYIAVDNEFRPFFTYYQKSSDYDNLFLVNKDGDVIFTVKGRRKIMSLYEMALYKDSQLAKVFVRTIKSSKVEISDFEYNQEEKDGALFIGAPVLKGSELIGVLILQMSNEGVSQLVKDYTSLGETGETILAAKIKNDIVFITPVRFDPKAAFYRKVQGKTEAGSEIRMALEGKKGSGKSIDYRGKEVLTVRRYFPSFRWGMVVKMDTVEVIASANRLRATLVKISVVLLTVVVAMAVVIARSMSKPIKQLTEVAGIISQGDFSARAQASTHDEIGILARSFNEMTDKLVAAKANVEQKKDELEEQHKLLEEANRELDSFTHTVSHDLQAPLRGVASFANFLEDDYKDKLDGEAQEYLKEIREGTTRMSTLIKDLLALSRISRIKNPFEEADINELVEDVRKRIEFDINKHNVDLKIQKNLPTIVCDRIKLTEVFLNLINNAIKFSSKQEMPPVIEVSYHDDDQCHKFSVKDNGIGIDPKYHDQIFGIFKRLHSADEFEGSGAGLSIVKKVIDDHKGKVWIESEAGKGTTFFFTVPKNLMVSEVAAKEEEPKEKA